MSTKSGLQQKEKGYSKKVHIRFWSDTAMEKQGVGREEIKLNQEQELD